jgi:hypothetical protein
MKRELCCFAAGLLAGGLLLAGCGRKSTPPASAVPPQNPAAADVPLVGTAPQGNPRQPVSPPEVVQPGVPGPAIPRPAAVGSSATNQTADGRPARPVPARPRDERPAPQDEVPLIRELRRSLAEADVESDNDRKSVGAMFDEAEPQLRRVLGKNSLRAIQQANQRAPYLVIEPPRKPAAKPATEAAPPTPASPTPRPAPAASAGE